MRERKEKVLQIGCWIFITLLIDYIDRAKEMFDNMPEKNTIFKESYIKRDEFELFKKIDGLE